MDTLNISIICQKIILINPLILFNYTILQQMKLQLSYLTVFIFSLLILNIKNDQIKTDSCITKDSNGKCKKCDDAYFLSDDGNCQYKIGGCQSYKNNICLNCKQGYLLINNACQSDCGLLCNTNSGTSLPNTNPSDPSNTPNEPVKEQKPPKTPDSPQKPILPPVPSIQPKTHPKQPQPQNPIQVPKKKDADKIQYPKPQPLPDIPKQQVPKSPHSDIPQQKDCVGDCDKVIIFDPFCRDFQDGECKQCYQGYYLNKNKRCEILIQDIEKQINLPNCINSKENKCIQCENKYWNKDGICIKSDENCSGFNKQNGRCFRCYSGYYLNSKGRCNLIENQCKKVNKQGKCIQCFSGYQLLNSKCVQNQINCKVYAGENCVDCYNGYTLVDNQCKIIESEEDQRDYRCRSWNKQGKCASCYQYYYLKNGKCVLNDPNCASFNNQGKCISCWATYKLQNEKCVPTGKSLIDPACSKWYQNKTCSQCSIGFIINHVGRCIRVDPNCKQFYNDGHCKQCYPSFVKKNDGYCRHSIDPDCNQWKQGKCIKCSQGYYFNQRNICTQIGPNCQTYNSKGICQSCYPNNKLIDGKCKLVKIDTLCQQFYNDMCDKCSEGAYFKKGICVQIDPNCLENDRNGYCIFCSKGFELIQNQCVQITPPTFYYQDNNCRIWKNGKCIQCASRSYFGGNGKCQTVDPNCKNYNHHGKCLQCWTGLLIQGKCNTSRVKNPNCNKYVDNHCVECAFGYFKNHKGICIQVSPLCKTWCDDDGFCTSCFDSYTLTKGKCIYTPPITFDPEFSDDINCADVGKNNKCIRCLPGFVLNIKNGVCIAADENCAEYDFNNSCCGRCYKGFNLKNGKCFL